MNCFPFGGAVPGPVEFGIVGGAAWFVVAVAGVVPALLAANSLYEIGLKEGFNALVDLTFARAAERRVA